MDLYNCPICGSVESVYHGKPVTNKISKSFIDKDYNVMQCKICDGYFVAPLINFTDDQWEKLYNIDYFSGQSRWLLKQRMKDLNQRFNRAERYITNRNNIRFLDIGTGEGKTLIEAINRGWDATGIDIVDLRMPDAKANAINFIKAKFLQHNFKENYFDFIYLDSVLEHVLTPVDYLCKIRKILKPGGVIYIGVPNEDNLFNNVRRLVFNVIGKKGISEKIKPFDDPYHVIGFNSNSLNYIVRKSEFKLLLIRNFGRKFSFLENKMNDRAFWISLFFLFPVETLGYLMKKDMYYELYLTKE